MDSIDFRSDTVTWPTPEMVEAMAKAKLGDDVYGEDPTINALEQKAAELLGKEAALFVASGTMANLVAILSHAGRGDQAIVGEDGHTFVHEAGGMAVLGGIMPRPLPTDHMGRMNLEAIEGAISPDDPHNPITRLILLENSYGERGGYPIPLDYFTAVQDIASRHNLHTHLDGARLFNAVTALGIDPKALSSTVDSVSFCLSKGLCAPVGSLVCGSADFIYQARRNRKILGGGMRQAGVLAAAGHVALDCMIERLAQDHTNARLLAQGLSQIPGIIIDPDQFKTNITFFGLDGDVPYSATEVAQKCRDVGNVWFGSGGYGGSNFRAVTHYWVGPEEVTTFLEVLSQVLQS
jgi:threonine aldolase